MNGAEQRQGTACTSSLVTHHDARSSALRKFQAAADLRLTNDDFQLAKCPVVRGLPNSHFQIRGGPTQKMLNMKGDPEMYMKTKDRPTQ
jgi:hypothetical protein